MLAVILFGFRKMMTHQSEMPFSKNEKERYDSNQQTVAEDENFLKSIADRNYIPFDISSEIVHHRYYSLGYNEQTEQANWVAYELTKSSIQQPNVKREKYFNPDYKVKTRSSFHRDYSNSGYTRGHLAPAGDMAFNTTAMKESFLMSNMTPQLKKFNNGVWKELEENVRDWAYKKGNIIVVSGPVFYDKNYERIGQNKVGVPHAFYKVLLDNSSEKYDAVAYLIPHAVTDLSLDEFATNIDEVEDLTGINFFKDFFKNNELEERIESTYLLENWKYDNGKYQQRVEQWNKQD
jgi:endonuclease G